MFLFFIFIYCLLFSFLSWRRPLLAIGLILAFLPSYLIRFTLWFVPTTLLEIMILILFISWLIKELTSSPSFLILFHKEKKETEKISLSSSGFTKWLIALWLLVATFSVFVSSDLRTASGIWKAYFVEPILFLLVFIDSVKTKKDLNLILCALGFSTFYLSVFAIYQKFTGFAIPNPYWQAEATRRVTSFFEYPNALGLYLGPIIVLYLGQLILKIRLLDFKNSIINHIFSLFIVFSSILAIVFARSEGAWAGVLAGLFFLFFFGWNKKRALIILLIFVLILFALPFSRNYILPLLTFQDESGPIRLSMWKEALQMLKDNLLFGAGLAGYQSKVASYHQAKHIEIYLYPHNIFLNFWSELGLGGLIIFLLIIINFFKQGFKIYSQQTALYALPVIAAMVCLLVHGLVDVPYFKNDLSVIFWTLIGMILVVKNPNFESVTNDAKG